MSILLQTPVLWKYESEKGKNLKTVARHQCCDSRMFYPESQIPDPKINSSRIQNIFSSPDPT
jgi:hypothetical protein